MANSTTTSLASLISPIVQEALFVASERSIMRGLVKNFDVANNTGKIAQVPIYPTATAQDLTEGTDMAGTSADQTITTTTKNITLAEVGIMTVLTDMIRDTSEQNVIAHLGKIFGESVARKQDTDLVNLFSGFSTESGGGAGQELTVAQLFKAFAELQESNAPGPYYGVFHPKAIYNVKSQLTNTFAGGTNFAPPETANAAMRNGFVGTIAGIQIFESSNISIDTDGDAIGAVFSPEALGIAMQNDMNMEMQRNASLRAEEVVMTSRYGVSELIDEYGVKLTSDATI